MEDFDFEKNTVRINKSYQRLQGQDVITTPKTPKSNRTIKLPKFLAEEMQEYFAMLYDQTPTDRIFLVTKSFLHHEMERGCKLSGVQQESKEYQQGQVGKGNVNERNNSS